MVDYFDECLSGLAFRKLNQLLANIFKEYFALWPNHCFLVGQLNIPNKSQYDKSHLKNPFDSTGYFGL